VAKSNNSDAICANGTSRSVVG